ncbi:MAG TPA: adenine phosphoribosyltransferase [Vicinamibacteria bacterium]|nr:adenine phosphoribosyltransferase [Vicinamibacteria bacterium]
MNVEESVASLKAVIRDVPDFPKPGIVFKDITTLLKNPQAFRRAIDLFAALCGDHVADKVLAIESRGFIVGSALADRLGLGFVPVRKPGTLPGKTVRMTYALEYGEDCLEIHADALAPGERVLVVDDVIATGGTARAAGDLVAALGGTVAAYAFLVELSFLEGRSRLQGDVLSLIRY